jgi:hypothetical protein
MVDGMDVSGPAAAVRKHAEMIANQALEAFMSAKRIWRDLMAARRVIWGKRFDLQVELSDMKCSRRRRIELDQELFANDELLEAADSNVARALAQTEGACDEACNLLQALLLTADSDVLIGAVIVLLEVLAAQGSRRMDELRRALATALALFETAQALIVSNAGGAIADRLALLERFREGDVTSDRADEVGQIVQFVDSMMAVALEAQDIVQAGGRDATVLMDTTAMVVDGDLVFGDDVLLVAMDARVLEQGTADGDQGLVNEVQGLMDFQCKGFSSDGRMLRPDGSPAPRGAPVDDWELLELRTKSVQDAGNRLELGQTSPDNAKRAVKGLERIAHDKDQAGKNSQRQRARDAKDRTTAEAFDAKREQNNWQRPARQRASRLARDEAAAAAKRDAAALNAAVSDEARAAGRAARASRREEKAASKHAVKNLAAEKSRVTLSRRIRGVPTAATSIVAAACVQMPLSRAEEKRRNDVELGRLSIMIDTGASRTWLNMETGAFWDGLRSETVTLQDAQGRILTAHGGGPLRASLRDTNGVEHYNKLIDASVFEVPGLAMNLLGFPSMAKNGWDLHVTNKGTKAWVTCPDGHDFALEPDWGGHWSMHMHLGPGPVAEPTTSGTGPAASVFSRHGIGAAASVLRNTGRPHGSGGASHPVTWPSPAPACDATKPPPEAHTHPPLKTESTVRTAGTTNATSDTTTPPPEEHTHPPLNTETTARTAETEQQAEQDVRRAVAEAKVQEAHLFYARVHEAWNHDTAALDKAIRDGVVAGAIKPPGFSCSACAMGEPLSASWHRNSKTHSSVPLVPYHHIEIDLWGPMDVGDRNGFKYVFGAIDRATGKLFLQPIRAKSDALAAMRRYFALVQAQCPGIELHLRVTTGRDVPVRGIDIVSSDRGGEFTTTNGATRSAFDEFLQSIVHLLNTPDTPQSGTSRIERAWRTIIKAPHLVGDAAEVLLGRDGARGGGVQPTPNGFEPPRQG